MRHNISAAIVAVGMFLASVAMAEESSWATDFEKTKALAVQKKVPLVLDFTATWGVPCEIMENGTLRADLVTKRLQHYQKVRIDVDENTALAKRFEIYAVPTFVLLGENGEEVSRISGAMAPREFCKWINSSTSIAAFVAVRAGMLEEKQRAITEQMRASNPTVRRTVAGTLLEDRLRSENDFQQFANENLKIIAKETPSALLDYLNDERLSVRIIVGNLLRQNLGNDFAYDPWADPAKRLAVIERWKPHLTAQAK